MVQVVEKMPRALSKRPIMLRCNFHNSVWKPKEIFPANVDEVRMMQTDPEPLQMQSEVEGAADRASAVMCCFLRDWNQWHLHASYWQMSELISYINLLYVNMFVLKTYLTQCFMQLGLEIHIIEWGECNVDAWWHDRGQLCSPFTALQLLMLWDFQSVINLKGRTLNARLIYHVNYSNWRNNGHLNRSKALGCALITC